MEIGLCHSEVTMEHHCHEDKVQDVPRVWEAEAELWSGARRPVPQGMLLVCLEAPGVVTGSSMGRGDGKEGAIVFLRCAHLPPGRGSWNTAMSPVPGAQ